jgi:hypothetical protein
MLPFSDLFTVDSLPLYQPFPGMQKPQIKNVQVSQICSASVVDEADLLVGRRRRVRRVPRDVVRPLHQQNPRHHVDEDLPRPRGHLVSGRRPGDNVIKLFTVVIY